MLQKKVLQVVFVLLACVSGVGVTLLGSSASTSAVVLAGDDEPTRPTGG